MNDTLVNLRNALQDKFVVGLHVRTYDPSFDWPVVPPPACPSNLARRGDESAPDRAFRGGATRPEAPPESRHLPGFQWLL